jgi:hypothetical protein
VVDQALNPVAICWAALPESANVGDHAIFMSGSQYIQNNGLSTGDIGLTHGVTLEWTLASHSAATADLCINQTISADFISTAKLDCFEIDATGKILTLRGSLEPIARVLTKRSFINNGNNLEHKAAFSALKK